MAQKKKPAPFNPNAPEFYPKQPIPQKLTFLYAIPTTSSFNNGWPFYSYQDHMLPRYKRAKQISGKNLRFKFCNQKLPPRLLKKKVCVHKNRNISPVKLEYLPDGKSSLMIRNIPNNFERKDLLRILDAHCGRENKEADKQQTRSSYDFLYLPMDFVKHANLGYAFVNFTTLVAADTFRRDFDNFFWPTPGNKKYCRISVAKIQGKEKLINNFKDSRFACHTDDYLPVVLSPPSDGFSDYSFTTVGYRVNAHGCVGGRRRS